MTYSGLFRNIKKGFGFGFFFYPVRDKRHNDKIRLVRALVFKDRCKSCIHDI